MLRFKVSVSALFFAKPKLLYDSLDGSRGTFNVIVFFNLFADIITGKLWLLKFFMDNKVNKFLVESDKWAPA